MSASSRRLLGLLLVSGSATAWIVALVFFSQSEVVGSGSSGDGFWVAGLTVIHIGWQYLLSVILCGTIGVLCLVWPSRKPPKLPH